MYKTGLNYLFIHYIDYEIFYKIFFRWSPHFSAFEPNNNPPKKYMQFQRSHPIPLSPEASSRDTWTQSLVTNFLSFNPCQHESNHKKQGLLITTSKISDCLLQLQIIKL